LRTENEMHDLVVAKVAAHKRRRALLATAGGGVAVVLLLVAVAAGAASSDGDDDSVHAGPGDPTTTTEVTTTTERPARTVPPATTTTTPPATTTTTEAPPDTDPAPTTAAPADTTTTTTTTTPPVSWPPQVTSGTHGGFTWGAYLAVAPAFGDPALAEAAARAQAVGYTNVSDTGNQLACDDGAIEALGLDPEVDWYATALYFASEADARRFEELFEPEIAGVARVQTYCMD
jgi:hypothetical protein